MKTTLRALLIFTLTATGIPQSVPLMDSAPKNFRWSERQAHELDYRHTIKTSHELSTEQRNALVKIIVAQLRHETFEDTTELQCFAADTRIEFIDLIGDGTKEIVAQSNGLGPCSATGNCILWVFQSIPQGYKLLLDSTEGKWGGGVQVLRVLASSSNGFRDIVLGSHGSATERTLLVYNYSDGSYRPSACYSMTWWSEETMRVLKVPRILTCKEP